MTTVVAAITSKVSTPPYPNEVVVPPLGTGLQATSTIRLDQIRTVDRQRLIKQVGRVDATIMRKVDEAIKISLGLVQL
jgi:mRNA interferase MazF